MKNIRIFYQKNCHFWVVKFSVCLNRRVFVMIREEQACILLDIGTLALYCLHIAHLFRCLRMLDQSRNPFDLFPFRHLKRLTFWQHLQNFDGKFRIIRNDFFFFFFFFFFFCEFTLSYHSQIQPKARVLFSLWFAHGVYPSIKLKKKSFL